MIFIVICSVFLAAFSHFASTSNQRSDGGENVNHFVCIFFFTVSGTRFVQDSCASICCSLVTYSFTIADVVE